jgi:hypothetical protein
MSRVSDDIIELVVDPTIVEVVADLPEVEVVVDPIMLELGVLGFQGPPGGITLAEAEDLVNDAIAALINAAPGTLDTLDEIAAALGDDPDLAATLTTLIGTKADSADLTAHIGDAADAHDASAISNTPYGSFTSTNVQATIDELSSWLLNVIVNCYLRYDAKGDIVVAVADNETGKLSVGTNGKSIVAASGETTGLKYDWMVPAANVWNRSISLYFGPQILSLGSWVNTVTYGYSTAGSASTPYSAQWYIDLMPGTWTLDFLFVKTNNSGIVDIDYSTNGGSSWNVYAANVDLYNATQIYGTSQLAGLVLTAPTRVDLRITSDGKNASSSAWYFLVNFLNARRTA